MTNVDQPRKEPRMAEDLAPEAALLRALEEAESAEASEAALRAIKNAVIGNRHKKKAFLARSVTKSVIQAVQLHEGSVGVQVQAAAVLASLARGNSEGAVQLSAAGIVPVLLRMATSSALPAMEAGARALRGLNQASSLPVRELLGPEPRSALQRLSAHDRPDIAEAAVALLASCWATEDGVKAFGAPGAAVRPLVDQLQWCVPTGGADASAARRLDASLARLHRAVLKALAPLLMWAPDSFETVLPCLPQLAASVRWPCAQTQLLAYTVIANLLAASERSPERLEAVGSESVPNLPRVPGVCSGSAASSGRPLATGLRCLAVPTLVKLLGMTELRRDVPTVLLRTMGQHRQLHCVLADSDVLHQLTVLIIHEVNSTGPPEAVWQSKHDPMAVDAPEEGDACPAAITPLHDALRCFHALCPRPDTAACGCRQPPQAERACAAVCSAATISAFSKCLRHPHPAVRESVARCFQVIGRLPDAHVKVAFSDPSVASAFMDHLQDGSVAVRTAMCLAICNFMAGNTRSMKTNLFERGIIARLVEMLSGIEAVALSPDAPACTVRLLAAALWALGNTVGCASVEEREDLLSKLSWPHMCTALRHCVHPALQGFAWKLLQSLAHSSDFFSVPMQQRVMEWSGGEVVSALSCVVLAYVDGPERGSLAGASARDIFRTAMDGATCTLGAGGVHALQHALYALSNLATGGEEVKAAIMAAPVVKLLPDCLRYTGATHEVTREVRMAACWVVINLTFTGGKQAGAPAGPLASALQARVRALTEAGVLAQLAALQVEASQDPGDPELKQRAKIAKDALDVAA